MKTDSPSNLSAPAEASLLGSQSVEEVAEREGWSSDLYTLALSQRLRDDRQALGIQLERLQALAGTGAAAACASAAELARHVVLLGALTERMIIASTHVDYATPKGSDTVERLIRTAVRCQRASQAAMGALSVLRREQASGMPMPAPDNAAAEVVA